MQLPPGSYTVVRSLPGEDGGGDLCGAIWVTNGPQTWLVTRKYGPGVPQSALPEAGASFTFNVDTDSAVIAEKPNR